MQKNKIEEAIDRKLWSLAGKKHTVWRVAAVIVVVAAAGYILAAATLL